MLDLGQNLHNYYRRLHLAPPVLVNTKVWHAYLHINILIFLDHVLNTIFSQLSKEAQDWANYLLEENKWEFSSGKDYSENIFQYFGKISESDVIRKAVDNWYNAISKYNWNHPEASTFSQVLKYTHISHK
jgi:hypothetical protein